MDFLVVVPTPMPTLSLEDKVDEHKQRSEMDLVQKDTVYLSPDTPFSNWLVKQDISSNHQEDVLL